MSDVTDASSIRPSSSSGVISAGTTPCNASGAIGAPGAIEFTRPPRLSVVDRGGAYARLVDFDAKSGRHRHVEAAVSQREGFGQLLGHARVLGGVELEHRHVDLR